MKDSCKSTFKASKLFLITLKATMQHRRHSDTIKSYCRNHQSCCYHKQAFLDSSWDCPLNCLWFSGWRATTIWIRWTQFLIWKMSFFLADLDIFPKISMMCPLHLNQRGQLFLMDIVVAWLWMQNVRKILDGLLRMPLTSSVSVGAKWRSPGVWQKMCWMRLQGLLI